MATSRFSSEMRDFTPSDPGMRDYYLLNGYVTVRGVIPPDLIDAILAVFARDIATSNELFFRQSTNHYERNTRSEHGYIQQSFLDIHDFARHPAFSQAARRIFGSPEIFAWLRRICATPGLALMQSMFFDQSVRTGAHQDWWYIDSDPSGHLLGTWIALEDIDPQAGQFYMLPKSMDLNPLQDDAFITHKEWLKKMKALVDAHQGDLHIPVMRKGDIIFWNSRTVHGTTKTRDRKFSRKSLTAHYLPDGFGFGNLFKKRKTNMRYKLVMPCFFRKVRTALL